MVPNYTIALHSRHDLPSPSLPSPPPPVRCASSTLMMFVPSGTLTPSTLTAWWPSGAWSHARETSSLTSG